MNTDREGRGGGLRHTQRVYHALCVTHKGCIMLCASHTKGVSCSVRHTQRVYHALRSSMMTALTHVSCLRENTRQNPGSQIKDLLLPCQDTNMSYHLCVDSACPYLTISHTKL